MKQVIILVLLLAVFELKAQKAQLFMEEFSITDQVITGSIDQKYPITMYLKFEEYSPENWLSYSVSGWYYYNNVKKKIPLVGVYSGRLVLYSFTDPVRADSVKQMLSSVPNPWEATDDLMNRSGFTEKFDFDYTNNVYTGIWENSQKQLNVSFNVSRIDLDKKQEFLVIPIEKNGQKRIDLSQIGPMSYGYSIFASKYDATGSKVLLKYEISSTANPNGMCGAGMEIGFVLLIFDHKGTLSDYREEQIESCLGNFWSESTEVPGTNGKKLVYKVTDSEDKVRTITIDGVNFSMLIK
ncbi:hypothetical protein D3C71_639600 [compost metagenome]